MAAHQINILAETDVPEEITLFALLRRAAEGALAYENVPFAAKIDITIVDDAAIRELNAQFREKDAVTDVLSFPLFQFYNGQAQEDLAGQEDPEDGRVLLGDMIINYSRACAQAEEYGHSPERECGFLTVHSVLHLLGYDHEENEEDRALMREREEAILHVLGLERESMWTSGQNV